MRHAALYLHNLGNDGLLRLLGDGFCLALLIVGEGSEAEKLEKQRKQRQNELMG
jgi:hypothetical protein